MTGAEERLNPVFGGRLGVPVGAVIRLMVPNVISRSFRQTGDGVILHSPFIECSLRSPGKQPRKSRFSSRYSRQQKAALLLVQACPPAAPYPVAAGKAAIDLRMPLHRGSRSKRRLLRLAPRKGFLFSPAQRLFARRSPTTQSRCLEQCRKFRNRPRRRSASGPGREPPET
jgi:hypothetical protein